MKTISISEHDFNRIRSCESPIKPQSDIVYDVVSNSGDNFVAVTPDGQGFYYYDTVEEAILEHG
jgi:hypothetical protein